MPKSYEVSVIIPSYNEETYIDRLLEALTKQDEVSFEVMVSDAQSGDGTDKIVNGFKKKLPVSFIESSPQGPSHGRNIGAKQAKGEWLLFLDADDDIDDHKFIRTLVDEAKKRGWQTATAKQRHRDPSISETIGSFINYRYTKLLAHTRHPVAPGWCILTRRELFEKNGRFNEKIKFGEDYDYVSRVGKHGFGFVESTYYYVDLRRARQEGVSLFIKGVKNEIYRHTHGYNLESNPYAYEFGKHRNRH